MSALDIFDIVWFEKLSPFAKLCAVDVINKNYKVTWRCALFEFFMVLAMGSVFWTFYDRDIEDGFVGCTCLGTIIQVCKTVFGNYIMLNYDTNTGIQ